MTDFSPLELKWKKDLHGSFQSKKCTISNGTGLVVQFCRKLEGVVLSGSFQRRVTFFYDPSDGDVCEEIGLVYSDIKRVIPPSQFSTPAFILPLDRPFARLHVRPIVNKNTILVRPEVGMALISGMVSDTSPLDGCTILVPLDYDVVFDDRSKKAVMRVFSVYVWSTKAVHGSVRTDEPKRKRTKNNESSNGKSSNK